jgi:hypothetical protein
MENNLIKTNQKKSRSLTIAENKRSQEIKFVLELKNEMIANNISDKLIKKYLDEEFAKINETFEEKIKKIQKNELKKQTKILEKDKKNKREKAINCLLKNKASLEEKGYNPEYIKKYVEKQYNEINKDYSVDLENNIYNVDLEQVNFID